MKLIVAEKSIAGSNIASILAGKKVVASHLGSAQVFRFVWNGSDCMVIPLRGHIVEVDFPKKYNYWIDTDLKVLVDAEVEYFGKETAIIDALKEAGKSASEVIIATDADREGESIGVEALNYIKSSNPNIVVKRAYFSAITKKDLSYAFSNLSDVNFNYADSADSRREIDLIWGAVLTRFLSVVSGKLGKNFLSVGRVQTPVLAIIVNREKERLAFNKKKYWEYHAVFEKDSKNFSADHKKGKFWDKAEAESLFNAKPDFGKVVNLKSSSRVVKKPTPFNTTDFLRQATSIGFSANQAMEIAEFLYQQGYTSYPRTDNTVYPSSLDLAGVLKEISKVPDFKADAEALLSKGNIVASRGSKETKDHPPIHPVQAAPKENLSDRQWKIYELIVRRFMATLADDALTENVSVDIDVAGQPFVANGQKIVDIGWKAYYPYSELNEVILPRLSVGDVVNLVSLDLVEKETQPPARYSQSSLIKLMEELNLGTKSTRHTIIQKLYSRHYIFGSKSIEPSKVAFAVIDSLEKNNVDAVRPDMTAKLEIEMDKIAAGKKTKKEVVDESRKFLHAILDRMLENKESIRVGIISGFVADSIIGKCPKCGGDLRILTSKKKKRFVGCSNYPKCVNAFPLPQKGKISPLNVNCDKCGSPKVAVSFSRRRFEMCLDPNCVTKADWKARIAEAEKAKSNSQGPVSDKKGFKKIKE
jgi:DNA topoisomerase-1